MMLLMMMILYLSMIGLTSAFSVPVAFGVHPGQRINQRFDLYPLQESSARFSASKKVNEHVLDSVDADTEVNVNIPNQLGINPPALEKLGVDDHNMDIAIKEAFFKFDKDKSGGLDLWELKEVLNYLDYDISFPTTVALLHEYDTDSNKQLDIDEFTNLIIKKIPKDVCATFSTFADDEGFLNTGALKRALSFLCVDKNSKEVRTTLTSFDANGDGRLGILGFAQLVSQLPVAKFWLKVDKMDPSGRIRQCRSSLIKTMIQAPKKKVSFHSMLATASVCSMIITFALVWAPGVDKWGLPRLFDVARKLSSREEIVFRITIWLGAIVSATGLFRIPPNAPSSRREMFRTAAATSFLNACLGDSNLTGLNRYTIDAWTPIGKFAMMLSMAYAAYTSLTFLDNAISGSMEGRDTVPLMGNRISSTLVAVGYYALSIFTVPMILPMLFDPKLSITLLKTMPINLTVGFTFLTHWAGLASLLMTLRFEGKIKKVPAAILSVGVFALCAAESVKILVMALREIPTLSPDMAAIVQKVTMRSFVYEAGFVLGAAVMVNAFVKLLQPLKKLKERKVSSIGNS